MEANNSSKYQNNVNDTDPEAQVGPMQVEKDAAANRPGSRPARAPDQSSQDESNIGDSSAPLFSMYSKGAKDKDDKVVYDIKTRCKGIIIFTGLFSAAVAALLTVTVQYLVPNSQDTSAFYLRDIYQVLADPNTTRTPDLLPFATPPPFSPSSYAIWVNSLWFSSLVINIMCALKATSLQEFTYRYIRLTQPSRCSPEKRARMRVYFANGTRKSHISSILNDLRAMIDLSVFFFFAGLAILLFNVNLTVFKSVVWLIGFFLMTYVKETLAPLFSLNGLSFTALSPYAWKLCFCISYLFLSVPFAIHLDKIVVCRNWQCVRDLRDHHRGCLLGGSWKTRKKEVLELSSDLDTRVLGCTIKELCNDDEMEDFFDAIPGFFKSKRVKVLEGQLPNGFVKKFWKAANGFFERTLSSESLTEDVKSRRLDIGMNALSAIPIADASSIQGILFQPWDQEPQNIEMGHTMARWCTSENSHITQYARCIATRILVGVRERNDRWIELAVGVLGLSADDLRAYIDDGDDSLSLVILISVARRDIHSDFYDRGLLSTLFGLNIRNTLPKLQHDFCMLWNDCVEEAKKQPPDMPDTSRVTSRRHGRRPDLESRKRFPVEFLRLTRSIYIRLHQGAHFSALTPPESYPSCDIQDHRQDSTISDSHAVPISTQPRDSPTASPHQLREMRENSLASPATSTSATLFVHSNSYSLDGTKQQDVLVASSAGQILSTAPASSPVPAASTAHVLNQPFGSSDAGPASTPTLPLPTSPAITTYPSHTPRLPDPELLALLSGTPLSGPRDSATLSRSRARGLMSQGNMYFTNAVLQLLVHCPPFWDLFNDLGRLAGQTGQRGQGEDQQTSGGTTPLVDATVRLLDEFAYKEDDVTEPFTPIYVYDAMKEKRQFKSILGAQQRNAEEYLCAYLDVVDEELLVLLTSISTYEPACTALRTEGHEGSQSDDGQTGVGKRGDYISPISRIFDGKFRMTSQNDTVKVESWRTLQLDIQPDSVYTVQDALALISQPKSEQVEPSDTSKASQKVAVLIEALPPVLIVHLKRFHYDAVAGGVVKNRKPVQFSPELEIPPNILVPTAGRPAIPARYMLTGVLYHHGTSASEGRYTVDVLHPNAHESSGEAWVRIDDDIVSTVGHEEVFGSHDSDGMDDRCAYLLLYRRAASIQT